MKLLEASTTHVELDNIAFDANNPRGEKEHQIITDPDFQKLISSIKTHGILEPLIVKKDQIKKGHFVLIDGERRLRATKKVAEDSKASTVPVIIAPDDADGRILTQLAQ